MLRIDKLVPLNRRIIKDVKNELKLQGHYLTGELERSIEANEELQNGVLILEAYAAGYIEDLEHGVPAEEIVINEQTLAEMTRYVELRMGYRGSKAANVAYLILRKQAKEGKPTINSRRFSQDGNRTDAINNTFGKNEEQYFKAMDEAIEVELDRTLFRETVEII